MLRGLPALWLSPRARCLSEQLTPGSERGERKQETVRKIGCLLKSQTGGNKEKRKKKNKKKPGEAITNLPSESRQKIALVCRALQKRRPLLAFKVPLKRKLSSSPRPDKGKEIRLITSGGEIPQPRCPGAGRLQPDCWGRPGNLPKGLGQNGSELEAPVLAGCPHWGHRAGGPACLPATHAATPPYPLCLLPPCPPPSRSRVPKAAGPPRKGVWV